MKVPALETIWTQNSGLDRLTYLAKGAVWQLRKRIGRPFVHTLPSGARLQVYSHSAFSGVFYSRWIERKDLLFIRRNAAIAGTFVDVGANVGLFSAQLFDRFVRFVMFEPGAASFAALSETCALNPSVSCRLMNIAVSDQPGPVAFMDEGAFSTTSRIAAGGTGSVMADTLDNVLTDESGDFVLKIDVEGGEERVFKGARGLLDSGRVKLAMFERLGRTNLGAIQVILSHADYVLFFVEEDGTILTDERALTRPLINLFACPRTVFGTLRPA